ncbi:MAG: MFS transporter [Gammaproteobacteria bacterium]|jgi:sugar phosphate permease|nr:MFS transporter [Gammaproteobacteria bacterium]
MLGLILAGEAIYALPFHVTRFFRPTVLDVFGLTNTELGTAQAVYGIIAMLTYFPGGPLADRFSARTLISLSLWTTAAGGLYMATLPGFHGSVLIWGFFGFTTILLFWAALIRATRDWGGIDEQGRAYGLLEGGRGLLAALWASLAALLFAFVFPEGIGDAAMEDKRQALRMVILGYTFITATAGIFTWFTLADPHPSEQRELEEWKPGTESVWAHIMQVLRLPAVWLISLVVICAYVAYKGFDNYSLYAVVGFGMSEVEAAKIVAIGAWMRPAAALAAGLLGDRFLVSRMTVACFALLLASQLFFAVFTPQPGVAWVLLLNILIGGSAMFGLRGLYFALFEEARIPAVVTGTAVGLVSVVGYTPDVFVSYTGGVLLDRSPGLAGHQHYFYFLAAFAAIGLLVSVVLMRMLRRQQV